VVLVDVEAHRGLRADAGRRGQLEAGELDGEHRRIGVDGAGDRGADVPDLQGVLPGGAQDGAEHADGGGLAVGAGDRQPRATGVGTLLLEVPGEFDLAPEGDPGRGDLAPHRCVGGDAGREDHETGRLGEDRPREVLVVGDDAEVDVGELGVARGDLGTLVEGDDVVSPGHQCSGRSASGATPSDDCDWFGDVHRCDAHSA